MKRFIEAHNERKSRRHTKNAPRYENCMRCYSLGGICSCEQGRLRPSIIAWRKQHNMEVDARHQMAEDKRAAQKAFADRMLQR